jgi:NAD(P)-dependent dehydrogenase (short-subunit alcohol dehydrogenase family)
MKNIVITGSTSGIGYGLADSFLELGCKIAISSRTQKNVNEAVSTLSNKYESNNIFGFRCDVQEPAQVQALWDEAKRQFGTVDIWINNAGIAHPQTNARDYSTEQINDVIDTNIKGTINGSVVALNGMQKQGFGSIYNMEGLGSDGRVIGGMALYGLSKSAVGYFTKAMAKETQGTPIVVGGLSPGMVATKLITNQYDGKPEEWERVKRIFSILTDRVETVAPWLAKRILANNKNGTNISWLTRRKLMTRFILSPFVKRNIFE